MKTSRYPFTGVCLSIARVVGGVLAICGAAVSVVAIVQGGGLFLVLPASIASVVSGVLLLAHAELIAMVRDLAVNSFSWHEAVQLASMRTQTGVVAAEPVGAVTVDDPRPEPQPTAVANAAMGSVDPTPPASPTRWRVTAIDASGKRVSGTIRAASADAARRQAERTMRRIVSVEQA